MKPDNTHFQVEKWSGEENHQASRQPFFFLGEFGKTWVKLRNRQQIMGGGKEGGKMPLVSLMCQKR